MLREAWPWTEAASGGTAVRRLKSEHAERRTASAPRAATAPARRAHLFAVRPMRVLDLVHLPRHSARTRPAAPPSPRSGSGDGGGAQARASFRSVSTDAHVR